MSRIGLMPISLPTGVNYQIDNQKVTLTGPKGTLEFIIPEGIVVKNDNSTLTVENTHKGKTADALFGFVRANIANIVHGITVGWNKTLELSGVGYRATLNGNDLVLNVGFSHPVKIVPPPGITFGVNEGKIVVNGIDKQVVGQEAAIIREVKKPEPYKGKGIKYVGEHIRKKAGKTAKAVGGATK
jgi:large subunit ribosomal protein L6